MKSERAQYVRFPGLALEWAQVSGLPPEMILRNICDWAVTGGFPSGAFVKATGASIDGFDIYMSFRAMTETTSLDTGIHLGGWVLHNNGQWGSHLLSEVLITAQDVLCFCEKTETLPPPSLLSGFIRLWAQMTCDKKLAPPSCPDAADVAAKKKAREFATGQIGSLRDILNGLQGGKRRIGFQTVEDGPINFEFWGKRWTNARDHARSEIASCGDDALSAELESLEVQWAAFVAQRTELTPAADSEIQANVAHPANRPEQRRSAGRPPGSGSYKDADELLVEEMRAAVLADSSMSCTAAASRCAPRAAGAGTLGSKAKRLARRYSEKYPHS